MDDARSGAVVLGAIVVGVVVALALAEVVAAVVRALGRRTQLAQGLARRGRRPLRVVLVVVGVWVGVRAAGGPDASGELPSWQPATEHALLIALILGVAWLVGSLAFVVEDAALARYRTDVPDNRHARRVRTQIMILRRVTVAVLVICALAAVLLTFDGARAVGAGVLASAGLVSVVVGLAAQTSLANVFAGLQLAFTDAIRVDDVVVVDDEWGRIEEITMTYVVVHVWDDRRLILPSTYFTSTPFENWTRRAADLLGTVELDLDWAVPVSAMRTELTRILQASDLWDHRVGVLQVTESTGGWVRVRALASAEDAPTLFDLRCHVREALVDWLQREHPEALPRTRWEASAATPAFETADPETAAGTTAAATAADRVPGPDHGQHVERRNGTGAAQDGSAADQPVAERRRERARTPATGTALPDLGRPATSGVPEVPDPRGGATTEVERTQVLPTAAVPVDAVPAGAVPVGAGEAGAAQPGTGTGEGATDQAGEGPTVRRRSAKEPRADDTQRLDPGRDSRLFTGSIWAVERSKAFSGPGEEVIAEREQTAEGPAIRPDRPRPDRPREG